MTNGRFYSTRTTLVTIIIILVVVVVGISFLLLATHEWFKEHKNLQVVVRDIGSLLFVSAAVGITWELVLKRLFLGEILAKAKLTEDVKAVGLVSVTMDFGRGIDWPTLLDRVQKLDIYFAYGRTWRVNHEAELKNIASRKGTRVRVVLPDPEYDPLMVQLATRFGIDKEEVKKRIEESAKEFKEIFSSAELSSEFQLWYSKCGPIFSFYRLDGYAILATYRHQPERGNVPTFTVEQGGSMFAFLQKEFRYLIDDNPTSGISRCVYNSIEKNEDRERSISNEKEA